MRRVLRCCCSSISKTSRQPFTVPVRRISYLASSTSLTSSILLPTVSFVVKKKIKAIRRPCSVHPRMFSTANYTDEHAIAFTNNDNEIDDDHKNDLLNLDQQLKEMFGDKNRRHYQNVWAASSASTSTSPARGTEEVSSMSTNKLLPVDSDKRLDRQSRFLLQLLQTLYSVGLTKTSDQVTTERCNAIISRLAAGPQQGDILSTPATTSNNIKSTNNSNSMIDVDHWQRTERARSILECMELYVPLEEQKNYNTPGGTTQTIPIIELPIPTHETYLTLLKMYASGKQHKHANCGIVNSSQGAAVAEIAMEHMANEAPVLATHIVERMQASGNLALRPTSLHWNQVFSCYANAIHRPNRALEAATLLYQLQNQNETTTNNNNNGNNNANGSSSSDSSNNRSLTDGSSFSHTLRCCVDPSVLEEYENYHHHNNNNNTFSTTTTTITNKKEPEKYANLAIGVAQRVWKGLQQQQQQQQTVSSSSSSSNNNSSTTNKSLSQQQDRVEDHLTGLLNEESDYRDRESDDKKEEEEKDETKNTSTNSDNNNNIRPIIDMTSFHFVHMLRVGRNFATLLLVVEAEQQHEANENNNEDPHDDHRRSTLQNLRARHEEWIRTIVQECMQHSKVNVFILQEMMYQGKILVGSNGGSSGSADIDIDIDKDNNNDKGNNNEEYLKWIQRVLLPSTVSTNSKIMNTNNTRSNAMHDSMSMKWDTEIAPALVEASKKAKARARANHNNNQSKSATYATVIQQTKILIKYLPSHWRSKAE